MSAGRDLTTGATRGQFLIQDRNPFRWQPSVNYTHFAELFGRNHEIKTGYMGWRATNPIENIGYPNQQQYRYRSTTADSATGCNEAANWDGCFSRPDSVLVYDYPNSTNAGEWYHAGYINDKITLSRKMTLNVGVRYDRYSSFLPEQGNPGTGPFATAEYLSLHGRLSGLRVVRAARCRRCTTSVVKGASLCVRAMVVTLAAPRVCSETLVPRQPT